MLQFSKIFAAILIVTLFVACDFRFGVLTLDVDGDNSGGSNPIQNLTTACGSTLLERLDYLRANAQNGSIHTIELTSGGNIEAQELEFGGRSNITLRLIGFDRERTIQLYGNGNLFSIGSGTTLILGENITLRGHQSNQNSLVSVQSIATLIMRAGSKILENRNSAWNGGAGGVFVNAGGGFIMEGGDISGNSVNNSGGASGVFVADGAEFLMSGGRISNGNNSGVRTNGLFTKTGGEISNNTADEGGGVFVNSGIFTMSGGRIYRNTANNSWSGGGGGVRVANANFVMSGGEILGNTAHTGGGVFVAGNAAFAKNAGVIHGSPSNTATAGVNNDRGHAVFVNTTPSRRRETTAGQNVNLDSGAIGAAGGWE